MRVSLWVNPGEGKTKKESKKRKSENHGLLANNPSFLATAYSDTWVLSIPSFRWINMGSANYTGSNTEALVGNNWGRHQHKCAVHNDAQMIVLGGAISQNGSKALRTCDDQRPPLRILNLASMTWEKSFDADAEYTVPADVYHVIGGEYVPPFPLPQPQSHKMLTSSQRLRRRNPHLPRRRFQRHDRRLHLRQNRRPRRHHRLLYLFFLFLQQQLLLFLPHRRYRRRRRRRHRRPRPPRPPRFPPPPPPQAHRPARNGPSVRRRPRPGPSRDRRLPFPAA